MIAVCILARCNGCECKRAFECGAGAHAWTWLVLSVAWCQNHVNTHSLFDVPWGLVILYVTVPCRTVSHEDLMIIGCLVSRDCIRAVEW